MSVANAIAALQAARKRSGPLGRIVLKPGKAAIVAAGAPILYSGAIARVLAEGPLGPGDRVMVCDERDSPLAWGVYNPHSSIFRVRILQTLGELARDDRHALDMRGLLASRLAQAIALRRACGLPSVHTSAYRLCNSEGDGLSGLTVDVLGDCLVVQASAAWVERHGAMIEELLGELLPQSRIHWRRNAELLEREEGLPAEQLEQRSEGPDEVEVREAGVRYMAAIRHGQKTGFYADQRDARQFIQTLAHGKRVLDLCCYTGGFALHAAVGGAREVIAVDSSEPALVLAARNAELNALGGRVSFVKADASDYMSEALQRGARFDLVILDPPKLAPSRKHLTRAMAKYRKLNAKAMQLVDSGGFLMSCSCSGAVTQGGYFLPMLATTAQQLGKAITLVRQGGSGVDHPVSPVYPEGAYLSNVTLRIL